ncbi:uncharacterized protein LOC126678379 [Mercurialis annua]|uniref:uncharacterized protein LOC126678379 n=1 Tax=Mercurialis annua TaxID=3986 RepID=UPI002160BC70|nr:uncharacterized protein LOC126678379 [Mercurialis annua]
MQKAVEEKSREHIQASSMTEGKSPLAVNVLSEKWPERFKIPNLDNFDGTGCPESHVAKFYIKIVLLDVTDAIFCKTFPTMLSDTTQRWFFTNIQTKRSSEELYRCRQGEGETLKAYIERFNNEAIKIEDLNNDMNVQTLNKGTRIGVLGNKLSSKKAKTYQEVMVVAQKCINDGKRQKTSDAPKKEESKRGTSQRQSSQSRKDYGTSLCSISKYTPYENSNRWRNYTRTHVMWPKKMIHSTGTRDENRCCKFHEDYGHDIKE